MGTYTAALAFGGNTWIKYQETLETWNGTNWTEVNDLNSLQGNKLYQEQELTIQQV